MPSNFPHSEAATCGVSAAAPVMSTKPVAPSSKPRASPRPPLELPIASTLLFAPVPVVVTTKPCEGSYSTVAGIFPVTYAALIMFATSSNEVAPDRSTPVIAFAESPSIVVVNPPAVTACSVAKSA